MISNKQRHSPEDDDFDVSHREVSDEHWPVPRGMQYGHGYDFGRSMY